MEILFFVIGALLGFAWGLVSTVYAHVKLDRKAASDGVIKLDGAIYKLEKIDV